VQVAGYPAEHYGYQAAADTMTVAQLLAHLATSTLWAEQRTLSNDDFRPGEDFGRYLGEAGTVAAGLTSKEAIIEALVVHGESLAVHWSADRGAAPRIGDAAEREQVAVRDAARHRNTRCTIAPS
jgi:hypothetical protein